MAVDGKRNVKIMDPWAARLREYRKQTDNPKARVELYNTFYFYANLV